LRQTDLFTDSGVTERTLGEYALVQIKGADAPVPARRLLGMADGHRAAGHAESHLVGRRWEKSAVERPADLSWRRWSQCHARAETAQCRMTPACAASQFFVALQQQQQQPYNSGAASPGAYAQAVQRSAYPDRYDQAFPQAVTLYDQLTRGD
jgi:hypothetical protein